MIKNGCIINGYVVLAIANGIALAYSAKAPNPYVVWRITADGNGVWSGYYTNTREDAERDFCCKAFEWFEDNAPINLIEENAAERIDSFNWHFDEASERIETCRNILDEIQQEIDNAAALVEDMAAEHEKLVGGKNAPQEEIAEHKNSITKTAVNNLSKMVHRVVDDMLSEYSNRVSRIDIKNTTYCECVMLMDAAAQSIEKAYNSLLANIRDFDTLFL